MQTTNFPMPLFYVEVEHELDLQSHIEQSRASFYYGDCVILCLTLIVGMETYCGGFAMV